MPGHRGMSEVRTGRRGEGREIGAKWAGVKVKMGWAGGHTKAGLEGTLKLGWAGLEVK